MMIAIPERKTKKKTRKFLKHLREILKSNVDVMECTVDVYKEAIIDSETEGWSMYTNTPTELTIKIRYCKKAPKLCQ